MYIRLIRNKAKGNAITGRLVIDGRWFCYTLERKGVEIPALCYHVAVTQSPKFKRLLPLVTGVPRTGDRAPHDTSAVRDPAQAMRQGIRIHRGSKPEHSSGCVLVVADNKETLIQQPKQLNSTTIPLANTASGSGYDCHLEARQGVDCRAMLLAKNVVEIVDSNTPVVGGRSAADVERELTGLILKAQQDHEEIILEVTDFTPGTEYGYNTPCPPELQKR